MYYCPYLRWFERIVRRKMNCNEEDTNTVRLSDGRIILGVSETYLQSQALMDTKLQSYTIKKIYVPPFYDAEY